MPKALVCNYLEAEAFKLKAKGGQGPEPWGRETAVSRSKVYPGIKETLSLLSN